MKPIDQLTDEELMAEFSSLAGGQPAQAPAQRPSGFVVKSFSGGKPNMVNMDAIAQEQEAKKTAELDAKRKSFSKDLGSFLAVDQAIPRGEGFYSYVEGLKSMSEALGHSDSLRGIATQAHDAASKQLRVSIARIRDVGNLSETEQVAAGQMIPKIFDSEKVTQLKRAYLKQMGEGVDSGNPDLVKETIASFMNSGEFKAPKPVAPSSGASSRFKIEVE